MANTFKFGNGEWAVGKETVLAYNDENNNFKPLPFTFDRGSIATVVNKDGLIETVGVDEPRIDYTGNTKGHLLLEPERRNDVTYSEDFSDASWIKTNTTITSNTGISPDGSQNADRVYFNGTSNASLQDRITTTSGQVYTFSIYIKKISANYTSNDKARIEGFLSGTVGVLLLGDALNSAKVGEFVRYSVTTSASTGGNSFFQFRSDEEATFEVWGAQVEAGSYATSYIPTSGSAETRSAETCSQTTPDGVIGQTEGTMYWEGKFQDAQNPILMQIVPSSANYLSSIYIDFNKSANSINFYIYDSGLLQATFSTSATTETKYKIALAYKQNDIQGYVNGVSIGSHTTATIQSGLNNLLIGGLVGYINNSSFIGTKPNEVKLYNTRLSNAELAALTS